MNLAVWWQQAYPLAVELEKSISNSPMDLTEHQVSAIRKNLPDILHEIQKLSYPEEASIMREYLIRSVTYLIHAYQELRNNNESEVEFYYSSALTQIAQLHYQLVKNGFAN